MLTKDIIKSSIYEGIGGGTTLSAYEIVFILAMAFFWGIYIYIMYRSSSKSILYSRDLNITLAGVTVIVAAIIIAMQASLVVSLGMVGALSIVRFRNAVKNPMDLLYLFWAISEGIICGVSLHLLAAILSVMMTLLLVVLEKIPNIKPPSLLVVKINSEKADYEKLYSVINHFSKYSKEKSRNLKNGEAELIIELKTQEENALLKELEQFEDIIKINFLAYDGESRI